MQVLCAQQEAQHPGRTGRAAQLTSQCFPLQPKLLPAQSLEKSSWGGKGSHSQVAQGHQHWEELCPLPGWPGLLVNCCWVERQLGGEWETRLLTSTKGSNRPWKAFHGEQGVNTSPEAAQTAQKDTSEQQNWAGLDSQISFLLDLIFLIHCHSHNNTLCF